MKKGLLLLMAAFMAFGVAVKASASARLEAMGADARQVGDMDLIWDYANMVTEYTNTFDLRLAPYDNYGGGTNEWGGLTFDAAQIGTLGIYVNRPVDEASSNYSLWNRGPVRPTLRYDQGQVGNLPWWIKSDLSYCNNYNNIVDVLWGQKFSDASFGVRASYGSGENGSLFGAPTDNEVYTLNAALGINDAGFGSLDIHASYAMQNLNRHSWGSGLEKDNGIYTAKFGLLTSSNLDSDNALRLFADAQIDGFKWDHFNVDYSDWTVDLGATINRKIDGGKGLLSTGLILDYINASSPSASYDFNIIEWNALWNASLEVPVANWLTVRTGLNKLLVAHVYDKNTAYQNFVYSDNIGDNVSLTAGFGAMFGNFTLDGVVSVSSLENTIYNFQPGNGVFYADGANSYGDLAYVYAMDVKYKL
jgi:hypothetical protein